MKAAISVLEHQDLAIENLPSAQSLTPEEADRLCAISASRPGFCVRGHRRMRFSQYAGVVNIGGRALEVLPKVDEIDVPTEACRGVLLRLLQLAEGLKIATLETASQDTRSAPLLDVFVASFFDELTRLLRGGLLRRYQTHEEDLRLVRGRLRIGRQIAANALRFDRIACSFDELTADNDWNRVLRAALRLVRPWLGSMSLTRRWIELWPAFDDVADVARVDEVFERLSPDRQVARYEIPVQWARWIVAMLSPSLRGGKAAAPGLLFDTNQMFERAVARQMRTGIADASPSHTLRTQVPDQHLAWTLSKPLDRIIGLRPDVVIFDGARPALIADTKWKRLSVTASGYLEPSNADVHQMLAYAAAFGCADLALIYPWHDDLKHGRETVLELPKVGGVNPRLHLVVLDIGADHLPIRRGFGVPIISAALS